MSPAQLIYKTQDRGIPIRVWQQGTIRWLAFDDGLIQSKIDLSKPNYLTEKLNRAMFSGILFQAKAPKNLLLAGMGGGSIVRFLMHRFPDIKGEAIEISEKVLSIAEQFFLGADSANWRFLNQDIRLFVKDIDRCYDIILLDIAIDGNSPDWLTDGHFLEQCRTRLNDGGHLVLNLIFTGPEQFIDRVRIIRQVFERRVLCLSVPSYQNILIFGFNSLDKTTRYFNEPDWAVIEQQWQIEFKAFYHQLLKDNPSPNKVLAR